LAGSLAPPEATTSEAAQRSSSGVTRTWFEAYENGARETVDLS
jgi:hypothetical protein